MDTFASDVYIRLLKHIGWTTIFLLACVLFTGAMLAGSGVYRMQGFFIGFLDDEDEDRQDHIDIVDLRLVL